MYPIPANATRIRYLGTDGNAYIDTGIVSTGYTSVKAEFSSVVYPAVDSECLFGSRVDSPEYRIMSAYTYSNRIQLYYKGASSLLSLYTQASHIRISMTYTTASVEDVATGTVVSGSFTSTKQDYIAPLYIFRRSVPSGVNALQCSGGRLHSFKIYENSTLVRSFVPVRVGQVGYLFDRVSGQLFGNAGTGDFVLGPDTFAQGVVPTRMMAMGARNTEVLGSVLIARNQTDISLYSANVLSSIPSNWTVSIWAKTMTSPAYGALFKLGNQTPGSGVGLGIGAGPEFTTVSGVGTKLIALREAYGWDQFTTLSSINSWHHYAISVNRTTKIAYVDGVAVGTKYGTLRTTGDCNISIGDGFAAQTSSNFSRLFSGNITRVALWNRTLSASEIASDYADRKESPSVTSGLSHYWPLQNAKNYLKDEVGSATLSVGTSNVTISTDTPFA